MAIEHCDNFSAYGLNGQAYMTNGVYAQQGDGQFISVDPDGISAGLVYRIGSSAFSPYQSSLRYVLVGGAEAIAGCALRYWLDRIPGNNQNAQRIVDFRNDGNLNIVSVCIDATGAIYAMTGDGTHIGKTNVPVLTANAWWHVESKYDSTAGTLEIRVEGLPVLTVNVPGHVATSQMAWCVDFSAGGLTSGAYMKDLVIWSGAGTHNNDFLGAVLVASLVPDSDVAVNWNLTGAATGFSILAAAPPSDATKYLSAPNPPPAAYVCTLSDLLADVTTVKGIMTMVRAQKTDGGDASLQTGLISSPADAPATVLGSNRPITVAETYWRDVFEVDPKTGAPWLPAAVNSVEMQINRTS